MKSVSNLGGWCSKLAGLGGSTGDREGEMKLGYVSGWVTAGSSAKIKVI